TFFLFTHRSPPNSTLFPYTTLFRSSYFINCDCFAGGKCVRLARPQDSYFCVSFLKRTPGPPPFSSMNSTPAVSSAARIAKLLARSEEHTSELQSRGHLVCRLLLEKK